MEAGQAGHVGERHVLAEVCLRLLVHAQEVNESPTLRVEQRLAVLIVVRTRRAIDGKEGVTFLIKVKECIEDPKKLPLDF